MELGGTLLLQAGANVRPAGGQYVGNPLPVGKVQGGAAPGFQHSRRFADSGKTTIGRSAMKSIVAVRVFCIRQS